jgi:formamidopyrimidine-DNA glycosylase
MTGRLHVVPRSQAIAPHTHLFFGLNPGGDELRFQDVRRFGSAELLTRTELALALEESRLGPEPFDLTEKDLWDRVRRTERCLKAVLLDQAVVAGVGNIYADESLFEAKLHPAKRGQRLKKDEVARLRQAIVKVLKRAIAKNGSTISNFFYGENGQGSYQHEFRAYGRTDEPCRRCRTPIRCIRLAGRSTHFCPNCQRAPRTLTPDP